MLFPLLLPQFATFKSLLKIFFSNIKSICLVCFVVVVIWGLGVFFFSSHLTKVQTNTLNAEFFSKAAPSGQTSLVKISDGSIKTVPASSQLSKPGTTVLRVSGGVITTAAAPAVALPTNGVAQVRNNVVNIL